MEWNLHAYQNRSDEEENDTTDRVDLWIRVRMNAGRISEVGLHSLHAPATEALSRRS